MAEQARRQRQAATDLFSDADRCATLVSRRPADCFRRYYAGPALEGLSDLQGWRHLQRTDYGCRWGGIGSNLVPGWQVTGIRAARTVRRTDVRRSTGPPKRQGFALSRHASCIRAEVVTGRPLHGRNIIR